MKIRNLAIKTITITCKLHLIFGGWLIFFFLQPAYGVDCRKLMVIDGASSLSLDQDPLDRFDLVHQQILKNNSHPQIYEYPLQPKYQAAIAKVQEATSKEYDIIVQSAPSEHIRTQYQFEGRVFGLPPGEDVYPDIRGEVLQKSQFKSLNEALGRSGMWFIFRTYSWTHLGYQQFAGPHMSVVIGDRVYEIGRRLQQFNNEVKLTTRGAAGPISMDINEFVLKTSLETQTLKASPGIFFATRIAGVGEANLQALAKYYEKEAAAFQEGKRFKYAMDPVEDPEGHNCVTYLTEPILNKELTGGLDLKGALSIESYSVSPVVNLYNFARWNPRQKSLMPMMFVDDNDWRTQLDARIRPNAESAMEPVIMDSAFPWRGLISVDHPQMRGFLANKMYFSSCRF